MNSAKDDLKELFKYTVVYHSKKTSSAVRHFEQFKNASVDLMMHRRGKLQKPIFHTSMIGLSAVGYLSSGVLGGNSMIASSFPGVGGQDPNAVQTIDPESDGTIESLINFHTDVSQKPRSEIFEYEVKSGETVSEIAQKWGVDSDTIKWANDLESINDVTPGDKLKILPVSGVAHTVKSGDTLESVAKKYSAEQQAILDFPFNDIGDDFKLTVGQTVIVPDGVPPEAKATPKPKIQPQFIASGPKSNSPAFSAPGGGSFMWPTSTVGISQYFAWYHPGLDLPNPAGPPVVASGDGTVIGAGWLDNYGFGNRVIIDHGNGYQTIYAHLSNVYVTNGQKVSRGQTVGKMGSTGRSTGTHLHFEIHFKGIAVNPLSILK